MCAHLLTLLNFNNLRSNDDWLREHKSTLSSIAQNIIKLSSIEVRDESYATSLFPFVTTDELSTTEVFQFIYF